MYSLALMTFDFFGQQQQEQQQQSQQLLEASVAAVYAIASSDVDQKKRKGKVAMSEAASHDAQTETATSSTSIAAAEDRATATSDGSRANDNNDYDEGAGGDQYELKMQSLMGINEAVLRRFKAVDVSEFNFENYDQFAMYFEIMRIFPEGQKLVASVYGADTPPPQPSGPTGTVPSRMHAQTVQHMLEDLQATSPDFSCFNEFNGLQGVFPVDCAVYYKDALVALVEVDGEFHYKLLGQQLRRKDRLKEHLYRCHYPNIPLYRMRTDQLNVIGYPKAGGALAKWIVKDLDLSK